MNKKLNANEEQAMDALLSEILGESSPPDLSPQILAKYSGSVSTNVVVDSQAATRGASKRGAVRPFITALSVVTALAASVLLLVWLQGQAVDQPDDGEAMIAANQLDSTNTAPMESVVQETTPAQSPRELPVESPRPRQIPKGIPLIVSDGDNNKLDASDDVPTAMEGPDRVRDPEEILLVSKRVDAELVGYWKSVGIQPTEDSALPDVAARLTERLGVKISPTALSDPESLRAEMIQPGTANQIARRWLLEVTGGGLSRVDAETQQRLVSEIAEAFQAKRRLDVTLAQWFGGDNPHASDWYAALAASGRDSMVQRIASLSMNVDLRCTQCHDAFIDGSGRQEDYWSFASLVRQGVHRDRDGQWTVAKVKSPGKPMFYELPDGRQRMVQPSVPAAWIAGQGDQPIQDVRQWSRQLVASPELARGIVNSFWKLIHQRRLRGGVVDTMTAPHSESLEQMEVQLVDDLLNSNFDVSRALALVIHSPATRRSVPTALQPDNALLANDSELRAARDVVDAFAGSLPLQSKPSINRRIDLAMRSTGGSLQSIREGNSINAQGDGSPGGRSPNPRLPSDDDAGGFPITAGDLPVQWLTSVKGFDNRVEHLGYLAGWNEVPQEVRVAASAMENSRQISEELALQRVWWLLSP